MNDFLTSYASYDEGYEAGKQAAAEQIFKDFEKVLYYNVDWIASISYDTFEDLKEKYGVSNLNLIPKASQLSGKDINVPTKGEG